MKKAICLMLISLMLVSLLGITAHAADADGFDCAPVVSLRAGGGSSGGGGGGGGGGSSSSSSSHHSSSNRQQTPLQTLLQFVLFLFLVFSSSIIFYIKLTQRARKAKKLMRQMMQGDSA